MARGRKPKPTKQKLLAGNPGKREINHNEPNFAPLKNIAVPEWMADFENAKGMWEWLAPRLCSEEIVTEVDLVNLESYCMAYERWRMAEIEVCKLGIVVEGSQGGYVKNPALTAVNEAKRQIQSFGALLGLDPSSRTRLIGKSKTKKDNSFDGF
ncbi:phage terminase small subunit P27 family [Glaciecola sp. 2405UD65-10]|uniref:phage terminase small subunit P27 family n=1 Tax=Glaciecola sp. 2405UD65-10 TaxID=3397244 RepID=UPI003B5CD51C